VPAEQLAEQGSFGGPLVLSSLGRKKIQADFNGRPLTSDTGGLLLREASRPMALTSSDIVIPTGKIRSD